MSPPRDEAARVRTLFRRVRREASAALPGDRRALISSVQAALAARRRGLGRRRKAFVFAVGLVASLTLAVGFLSWRRPGGEARSAKDREVLVLSPGGLDVPALSTQRARDAAGLMVKGGAQPEPLRSGMRLQAGIRLLAPAAGEVRVGTAAGTALTLEPGGALTVTEADASQRFLLERGALRVVVAPLLAGERFIVDTVDARLEVHGTMFRVSLVAADERCEGGNTTRVSVERGVVAVRRRGGDEVRVLAGQRWPSDCGSPATAGTPPPAPSQGGPVLATASTAPAAITASRASPIPAASTSSAPRGGGVVTSDLAVQNDLFAVALSAKRAGRIDQAVAALDTLMATFPRGPLFESALAQKMKLLATADPAAAARVASTYLARFPSGFARAEARALTAATAP